MEFLTIILLLGVASPLFLLLNIYFENRRYQRLSLEEQRKNLHERIDILKAERTRLDAEISITKSIDALLETVEKMRR